MTWLQKACAAALLPVACIVGCECPRSGVPQPPWPLDVEVSVDRAAFVSQLGTIPSLEVNLIGITGFEYSQWRELSMTAYWMPDNPERLSVWRGGYAHRMNFDDRRPTTVVLSRKEPIWSKWGARRAAHLFVLVNYPRAATDQYGSDDPRRLVLPWGGEPWRHWSMLNPRTVHPDARIRLEITPAGIRCNTPPGAR